MYRRPFKLLMARLHKDMTEEQLSDLEYQFRVIFTLDNASKSQAHFAFVGAEFARGGRNQKRPAQVRGCRRALSVQSRSGRKDGPRKPEKNSLPTITRKPGKFTRPGQGAVRRILVPLRSSASTTRRTRITHTPKNGSSTWFRRLGPRRSLRKSRWPNSDAKCLGRE